MRQDRLPIRQHSHIIPNAPHNSADLYAPESYYAAVEGFMGEHVAGLGDG